MGWCVWRMPLIATLDCGTCIGTGVSKTNARTKQGPKMSFPMLKVISRIASKYTYMDIAKDRRFVTEMRAPGASYNFFEVQTLSGTQKCCRTYPPPVMRGILFLSMRRSGPPGAPWSPLGSLPQIGFTLLKLVKMRPGIAIKD